MPIIVIGVNHKTAPVSIREKVAFSPDKLKQALQSIGDIVDENLILSTCNRTEIYAVSKDISTSADKITKWLAKFHKINHDELRPFLYIYPDDQAVKHVLRVSCGLDSLVLGEPQILGQLKSSLKTASEYQATGSVLNRLMQHVFTTAKKVRTQTDIGSNPVSVAFAAVSLAKKIFSDLSKQTALLVGAGETIELVGQHLSSNGIGKIIVANRSLDKAERLAETYSSGKAITLEAIADNLPKADIVISSTAAPVPIIGKGSVERALKIRKHQPVFMVDIAVPRDIEPEVEDLDDVYLYTVDDLQSVIEENLKSRQAAAEQAEEMIGHEIHTFINWLRAQSQMQYIRDYRSKSDHIRKETLDKALKMLNNGKSAEETLQFLAHTLTNKLSHDATVAMNKAAHSGDTKLLKAASRLFNLDNN